LFFNHSILVFLTFWLSYCKYSFLITSTTYHPILFDQFYQKYLYQMSTMSTNVPVPEPKYRKGIGNYLT